MGKTWAPDDQQQKSHEPQSSGIKYKHSRCKCERNWKLGGSPGRRACVLTCIKRFVLTAVDSIKPLLAWKHSRACNLKAFRDPVRSCSSWRTLTSPKALGCKPSAKLTKAIQLLLRRTPQTWTWCWRDAFAVVAFHFETTVSNKTLVIYRLWEVKTWKHWSLISCITIDQAQKDIVHLWLLVERPTNDVLQLLHK